MASDGEEFEVEDEYEAESGEYDDEGEDEEQIVEEGEEGQRASPYSMDLPAALRNIPNIQQILGLAPQPVQQPGPRKPRTDTSEWHSLRQHPNPTQQKFLELLRSLQARQQKSLTVLFFGKGSVGKSSTINSILGERVAGVSGLSSSTEQVDSYTRKSQNFSLTLLDTPGLISGDTFDEMAMQLILTAVKQHQVDVFVYVDRLDVHRIDRLDHRVMRGITQALGQDVWAQTIVCLTHGSHAAPSSLSYDEVLTKRCVAIQKAVKSNGAKSATTAVVVTDNSAQCERNNQQQKVLPNGSIGVTDLMSKVVGCAMDTSPYEWSPSVERATDPNKRRRWLIIPVILAQVAIKKLLIDRLLEDDGAVGDQYGPFEPETVAENRDILRRRRETAERRKQRQKTEAPQRAPFRQAAAVEHDDEDDEEFSD